MMASPGFIIGSSRILQSMDILLLIKVGSLTNLGRSCAKKSAVRLSGWAEAGEDNPNQNKKNICFKVLQILVYFQDGQNTAIR